MSGGVEVTGAAAWIDGAVSGGKQQSGGETMGAMRDLWRAVSGPFRRRQPVRPARVLVIPEGEVSYLVKLFDMARHGKRRAEGAYRLWRWLNELFPETRRGAWAVDMSDPRRPVVREQVES